MKEIQTELQSRIIKTTSDWERFSNLCSELDCNLPLPIEDKSRTFFIFRSVNPVMGYASSRF